MPVPCPTLIPQEAQGSYTPSSSGMLEKHVDFYRHCINLINIVPASVVTSSCREWFRTLTRFRRFVPEYPDPPPSLIHGSKMITQLNRGFPTTRQTTTTGSSRLRQRTPGLRIMAFRSVPLHTCSIQDCRYPLAAAQWPTPSSLPLTQAGRHH